MKVPKPYLSLLSKRKLATACAVVLISGQALADIASASIKGAVVAAQQPRAGLIVEANNIDNGHKFTAVTKSDGSYNFTNLPPGNYRVRLQADSSKTETLKLQVGQAVNLNFAVDVKSETDNTETVVVTGTRIQPNKGGEIGTNITPEQIKNLPQNSRNFLSSADLAPGVAFVQGDDGSTRLRGGAQSSSAVNVFIDGVGQKNYILKGGVSGQDSSRGDPFPQSAIKEYKVITQNYSAEYDQVSSAAITAVTESGGNEFHGGFFYDHTEDAWRDQKPLEKKNKQKTPSSQNQFGVSASGPIIQDRLHFFVAYEGKDNDDPKDVTPAGGVTADQLPADIRALTGGKTAYFKEDLWFAKLDLAVSEAQQMEFTAKIRSENELAGLGGTSTEAHSTDKSNDENRFLLSHNYRADSWSNKVVLSYEDAQYNPHPHTYGNGIVVQNPNRNTILALGGGEDFQEKSQKGWGIQNDFTFHGFNAHEIKSGIKYKSLELSAVEQQPYNPQYRFNVAFSMETPVSVKWGAPLNAVGNGVAEADNQQFGIYLQDDWQVTQRLKANIGLRWDYEESSSYLDYVTPASVRTGIANWEALALAKLNMNDYISDGNNREAFKDAWQPRLGFTYKLNEDSRELFGGVGRAYDRNLFDYLQTEITKSTFPTYEYFFNYGNADDCKLTAANCVAWDPKYFTPEGLNSLIAGKSGGAREVNLLNNRIKTPYSDQFSFGLRDSFGDWNAEISVSRVESKDGFAWLLANRRPDGNFFEAGRTWGPPFDFGTADFSKLLISTNGIETKSNSVYLKAEKPFDETDNWGLSAAYTFSSAKQNRKLDDPYAMDYPDLSGYAFLPSTTVPKHRLVLAGSLGLPWDFMLSSKWTLESQKTIMGIDCRAGWQDCKYNTMTPDTGRVFGFNQWDISLRKAIFRNIGGFGEAVELRLDILNVMDSNNYDGFEDWFGGAGEPQSPILGKPNLSVAGPPRTAKLGISWQW